METVIRDCQIRTWNVERLKYPSINLVFTNIIIPGNHQDADE